MVNSLVSVIIPVYNIESYISECLESALGQTYSNVEVIVVDDGSTDNSFEIVKAYALNHRNMTCIQTPNQGPSAARNVGLDAARGRHILFLDGDDYLERDAVSRCMDLISQSGAGVVLFSSKPFIDRANRQLLVGEGRRVAELVGTIMPASMFLLRSLRLKNYMPSVCLYMFDCHLANGIRFTHGILHEDNLFTTRLLLENGEAPVVCIADELFNRRVRPNSITTMSKTTAHARGFLEVARHLMAADIGVGEQERTALFWIVQFALKESLSAWQKAKSVVPLKVRWEAAATLIKIPVKYWQIRYLPFLIVPGLFALRALISGLFVSKEVA